MIHLITGQPGAGKTLYALNYVEAMRQKESREVYYNGIAALALPWTEFDDPAKWFKLPTGAIIVLDEAQRLFRPRAYGKDVPDYVRELETHRHAGQDVVVITQDPMLVDANVRRLVGRHLHVVRTFGMQRATVHEWQQVKEHCAKTRTDSVQHKFAYPAAAFGWYKSAEVHTHKRRIPARLWFLLVVPLLVGVAGYYLFVWTSKQMEKPKPKVEAQMDLARGAPVSGPFGISQPGQRAPDRVKTRSELLEDMALATTPLVPGLPHTAPQFAALIAPKQVPAPVACVSSGARGCRCYTGQGTRIADVRADVCSDIVSNGFFVSWEEKTLPPAPAAAQIAPGSTQREVGLPTPGRVAASSPKAAENHPAVQEAPKRGPALPPSPLKKLP